MGPQPAPVQPLLIECPACKAKVSFEAEVCPKCGQPITGTVKDAAVKKQVQNKKNARDGCIGCLVLIVIVVIVGILVPHEEQHNDFADQYRADAVSKCSRVIERYAKYGYEWGSMWDGPRFPYAVPEGGGAVIRFVGNYMDPDALRFQNGFGVMVPMDYSCVYDTKTKEVVRVEVEERGR